MLPLPSTHTHTESQSDTRCLRNAAVIRRRKATKKKSEERRAGCGSTRSTGLPDFGVELLLVKPEQHVQHLVDLNQ